MKRLVWMMGCLGLIACSQEESFDRALAKPVAPASARVMTDSRGMESTPMARYMAIEHHAQIKVDAARLSSLHQQLYNACLDNVEQECVVLSSHFYQGDYPSAELRVRAQPAAIKKLMEEAGAQGEMISRSSTAEDLAGPITDADKRLAMLKEYREQLQQLSRQANKDVEALIKVSEALAQVQSDIESLAGERGHLQKRVDTQLLNLSLQAVQQQSFWTPVREALKNFGQHLAQAIAGMLTFIASVLPWTVLIAVLWLVWRMRKRRRSL